MPKYSWYEISEVPCEPGVYAWYYVPELTAHDLKKVMSDIAALKSTSDLPAAKDLVRNFLHASIFRFFQEEPYVVQLRGALKPSYDGSVLHSPQLSESLVERIVDEPNRLEAIRSILDSSAPEFASPIYIGMSKHLGTRLKKHKNLIEKYGETQGVNRNFNNDRDHSFAREIRARGIPPSRLFVITRLVGDAPGAYIDVENIFNRIHYPLLGRN